MEQGPGNLYEEAAQALWNILYTQLRSASARNEAIRPLLGKVIIQCVPEPLKQGGKERRDEDALGEEIQVRLSGVAIAELVESINEITAEWIDTGSPACVVKGIDIFVKSVTSFNLRPVVAVPVPETDS
jgi:hypothetical protein